jgi:hypothetical protein
VGVGGWDVIEPFKMIRGKAVKCTFQGGLFDGDDDWSLFLEPSAGFEFISAGNDGGQIECEIRTPFDNENSLNAQFGEFLNREVRAGGAWVKDVSHDNKKELHPLFMVLCDFGFASGYSTHAKAMVMSDHSPPFMVIPPRPRVPYSRGNVSANFTFPFPPAPHDDTPPHWSQLSERNLTDSREYSVTGSRGSFTLHGHVESGSGDSRGYYRGHVSLGYDTSRAPAFVGLLRPAAGRESGVLGWDPSSFFPRVQDEFRHQQPVTRVRTHVQDGHPRWSALFMDSSSGARIDWNLTWEGFLQLYHQRLGAMNLVDLEGYLAPGGSRLWTATWYDGTAPDGVAWGSLDSVVATGRRWGLPMTTLKTWVHDGVRSWVGVFRAGAETVTLHQEVSWEDLVGFVESGSTNVVHIEPYVDDGVRRWAVLLGSGANDTTLTWWPTADLFGREVQRLVDRGLSLYDFAVCRGWR